MGNLVVIMTAPAMNRVHRAARAGMAAAKVPCRKVNDPGATVPQAIARMVTGRKASVPKVNDRAVSVPVVNDRMLPSSRNPPHRARTGTSAGTSASTTFPSSTAKPAFTT